MLKGFNLSNIDSNTFHDYLIFGDKQHQEQKKAVKHELDTFFNHDGNLDASRITANWFPNIDCDVFISHSHADSQIAIGFSGFLFRQFGITSFIDSCAWGYSDDLLRILDDQYCYQPESETYSYERRNKSTTHVNMMLSVSLSKMIDKCECLFFLNTPKSIKLSDFGGGASTASPWIYAEIALTNLIEKKLSTRRPAKAVEARVIKEGSLPILYNLDTSHLTDLSVDDIISWKTTNGRKRSFESLDVLYGIK